MTTNADKIVSATRTIAASADVIFDLLADPERHHEIDGSDSVIAARSGNPERLSLGARFGMNMRLGVPYRMTSQVVEFEENRVIAWRHFGHHVWRYELEPVDGGTQVTESFNWGVARFPPMYEWVGYPARHEISMAKTLERLETVVTRS
ncbi:MAG: SRPBCC family protein [Actinomycetota bacterium]